MKLSRATTTVGIVRS